MEKQTDTFEAIERQILDQIAEQYLLPRLEVINRPNYGLITDNAILKDGDGNGYFVKQYDDDDFTEHASAYRAAEIIAQNPLLNISLPLISQKHTYTVTVNGKSLALFTYIPHTDPAPIIEENEEMEKPLTASLALNLGRMHAVSLPANDPLLKPIKRWTVEGQFEREQRLHDVINLINNKTDRDDFDQQALFFAETKLNLIAGLPSADTFPDRLSVCHGDYHAFNTLFDEHLNVISILDWDNAGLAHPYIDFLNSFMVTVIGRRFSDYQTNRIDIARLYSENYQRGLGSEINFDELYSVYRLFMHERISSAWPVFHHYFQNYTKNDDRLEPVLDRAVFNARHYDEIWEFVTTSLQ